MAYRFEDSGDIVIDGWEKGIGKDQFSGFSDMRNVEVHNTGYVQIATKPQPCASNGSARSTTFTVNTATEVLTVASSLRVQYRGSSSSAGGLAVTLSSTGTLPAGLSSSVIYYAIKDPVAASGFTFSLASSYANLLTETAVNITDTGTGTHTVTTIEMGRVTDFKKISVDLSNNSAACIDHLGRVWVQSDALGALLFFNGSYSYSQWVLLQGNTLTGVQAAPTIEIFQNWIFVFRGVNIDVYGPIDNLTTSATWYNAWRTTLGASTTKHVSFINSGGTMYWADKVTTAYYALGQIGSLHTNSTTLLFTDTNNPTTSSNFTFTVQALDLPSSVVPTAISELGTNLMIGTNSDKIYPWDTISDSFSVPIGMPELYTNNLLNSNNILYIFCGIYGNVYKTNGTQVIKALSIPNHQMVSGANAFLENSKFITIWNPVVLNGQIVMGVSGHNIQGIYTYDIETDVLLVTRILEGSDFSSNTTMILPLVTSGVVAFGYGPFSFMWSSNNGTTSNCFVDNPSNSSAFFTDYSCNVTSDAIPVGTFLRKRTLQQIEFKLLRPLASGEGIQLSFKNTLDPNEVFTTIGTYLFDSNNPTVVSFEYPALIENSEWLLIKIGLLSFGSGTPSRVQLKEIRLR